MKVESPWDYIDREYVKRNGYSYQKACVKIGINPATLYRLRSGMRGLTPVVANLMEEAGIATAEFLLDMQDRWNKKFGYPPVDRTRNTARHFNQNKNSQKEVKKEDIKEEKVESVVAALKKVSEETMERRAMKKAAPVKVVCADRRKAYSDAKYADSGVSYKPEKGKVNEWDNHWKVLNPDLISKEKEKNGFPKRFACHYKYGDDDTVYIRVKNVGYSIPGHDLTIGLGKSWDKGVRVEFRYE